MKLKNQPIRLLCAGLAAGLALGPIADAQAPEKSPREQVEAMVVLNENGLISITYEEPWFWEVGYYAVSLWSHLADALDAADAECAALSESLADDPHRRLDEQTRRTLDSQLEDGRIKDIRLLSSLLKKYSASNPVDAENPSDRGTYWSLEGDICSNLDADNPGYLQQMFPRPKDNAEAYYQSKCQRIEKTVACLQDLVLIDDLNRRRQGGKFSAVGFSPGVFAPVADGDTD